ncbi:hypothetical protein [uncultured Legionella sp.]|uniref:hypothetical protein n=1 Tax=uncultured Legionella sp. TaxID=210934 RepID=UPI00262FB21F|nr:hypothetical protein [uncultured Legionella sp.]
MNRLISALVFVPSYLRVFTSINKKINIRGFWIVPVMLLSSCQTQVMPKPLPVFDFRQGEKTTLNPPRYYACGDVYFPCSYQQKVIIKKEK